MENRSIKPHSLPLLYSPEHLEQYPGSVQEFYDRARSAILGQDAAFVMAPNPGQQTHLGLELLEPLEGLSLRAGSILLLDTFPDQATARNVFTQRVEPALAGKFPSAQRIEGLELIGCQAYPDLSGFNRSTAHSVMMLWPDFGPDAVQIHGEVCQQVITDQPRPDGAGIHFAYLLPGNQLLTAELWESRAKFAHFDGEKLQPAVRGVFEKHGINGRPTLIASRPLGLGVAEEVRLP